MSERLVGVGDSLGVDIAGRSPADDFLPVSPGEYPLDREHLGGLGERSAPALGGVETDIVKPYLVGPGGILDDGHAAHAYGTDALILVRPDGYIGLVADPAETGAVAEYLRSL